MAEEGKEEKKEDKDQKVGEAVKFLDPLDEFTFNKPTTSISISRKTGGVTRHEERTDSPPLIEKKEPLKKQSEIEKLGTAFLQELGKRKRLVSFILLAVIIAFGTWIRTLNISSLKWKFLLGVDPYLFLRYSQEIVEAGKSIIFDSMRYFPVGFPLMDESRVLPFFLAYLHKFFSLFNSELTVVQTAIAYPVIFFALSLVVFFFLIRRLFNWKVALLATAFLSTIPILLYRTLAGFSDKEPLGLFFLFVALYFMVSMWQEKNYKKAIIYSILAGLSTSVLGLTWGVVTFILMIFSLFVLIFFLLGKDSRKDFLLYALWYTIVVVILSSFTYRYGEGLLEFLFKDPGVLLSTIVFTVFLAHTLFKHKFKKFEKLPATVTSFLVVVLVFLLGATFMLGPSFVIDKISSVPSKLLQPLGGGRLTITVHENLQPYVDYWLNSFTWWFFWIFFFGSIYLFYKIVSKLKSSYKIGLTLVYVVFLVGLIFSRYSNTSIFNGTNFISQLLYFGGMLLFLFSLVFIYFKLYYKDKEAYRDLLTLDKNLIFVLIWFIWLVIGARGAVRIFFLFAPIACVIAAFFFIELWEYGLRIKDKFFKFVIIALVLCLCLFSLYTFTKMNISHASVTSPDFNLQWQGAAQWINENTQQNAVFASWWDYGYWIQTMGERATILDGGNVIPYWNYLMARQVLTSSNSTEALEFLYAHNVTHFLIDSSDVEKYLAFSFVGSDETLDRRSKIGFFDLEQTSLISSETVVYVYEGFSTLYEDVIFGNEMYPLLNTRIISFLIPMNIIDKEKANIIQPTVIILHQGEQIEIPVECVYLNDKFLEFELEGLDGCIYLFPQVVLSKEGQINAMEIGSLMYLSPKVKESLFTRLYLFDEEIEGFNLVHEEEHHIIRGLEEETELSGLDRINVNGKFAGPIKIWEISYPSDIAFKEELLAFEQPSGIII